MESVSVSINHWPQALVAGMMISQVIFSIVQHGKPMSDPTINARHAILAIAWYILVLGMGGFWK